MKWFNVTTKVTYTGGQSMSNWGQRAGTSLHDATQREMASLQRSGWLDDSAVDLSLKLEYDEVRTKLFNQKDLWGPYL